MSSLAILNLPLKAADDGAQRLLVLNWNKDEPYTVHIKRVTMGGADSVDLYKVYFLRLTAALHHCSFVVEIEENGHAFESMARAQRAHARGYYHAREDRYGRARAG